MCIRELHNSLGRVADECRREGRSQGDGGGGGRRKEGRRKRRLEGGMMTIHRGWLYLYG